VEEGQMDATEWAVTIQIIIMGNHSTWETKDNGESIMDVRHTDKNKLCPPFIPSIHSIKQRELLQNPQ
jgi:hypothetical protein